MTNAPVISARRREIVGFDGDKRDLSSFVDASKVTAWLDCPHFLTLKHEVERGTFEATTGAFGEFAQLLMDKGLEHEQECLAQYRAEARPCTWCPTDPKGDESSPHWVASVSAM